MKKILFLILMVFSLLSCNNKKTNSDILYFENPSYEECNIPVIETCLDSTKVCFIIDTGANMS